MADGWPMTLPTVRGTRAPEDGASRRFSQRMQELAYEKQFVTLNGMSAQTLGFAVQPEDRPLLEELVAYFGNGNRSAYLRATLKVMRSVMLADQLRDLQAYGQQRTAELGIEPADIPARVQDLLKDTAGRHGR
jgi:hypothetical protein